MMILNGALYQCSVLNRSAGVFHIFMKCSVGEDKFLGCYTLSINAIMNKYVKPCTYIDYKEGVVNSFIYRPTYLKNNEWTDMPNWIKHDKLDESFYDSPSPEYFSKIIGDKNSLVKDGKVMGIEYSGDMGIISASIMSSGIIILFYDYNNMGVRMGFSDDQGRTWKGLPITLIDNGSSAIYLNENLFYIKEEGIFYLPVSEIMIYELIQSYYKNKGELSDSDEENIVEKWRLMDMENSRPVGTGQIPLQKISGYVTPDGLLKIFYYTNGIVTCMVSNDMINWKVSSNF